MPWSESVEELREEFLREFLREGVNRQAICQQWGISRKTAYKWARRYASDGRAGLRDQSRAPVHRPQQTGATMERRILDVREAHPTWGARKIAADLQRKDQDRKEAGEGAGSQVALPALSTITAILRRNGQIATEASQKRQALGRFEREEPNELWQMDFKGHFALPAGGRCHPLLVLDDHSRFLVQLLSCADEQTETVRQGLIQAFRRSGLPQQMLMDNGAPWGNDPLHVYTPLGVWLLRLGIRVLHGRPRHPQTQGKLERLNRTLGEDVLPGREWESLQAVQEAFDCYRALYNEQRPHEALSMDVPASRYRVSERSYPERLPALEYEAGDLVRKVQQGGRISYQGREYRLPKAFYGEPVALRLTEVEGQMAVYFAQQRIALLDLKGGRARPVRC